MALDEVLVQPALLFSLLASYQRRSESSSARLTGVILGTVTTSNASNNAAANNNYSISPKQHFVVPHSEVGDQISINGEYLRHRIDLYKKGPTKGLSLLGWFTIRKKGSFPRDTDESSYQKNSEFIQEFFCRETAARGAPFAVSLALEVDEVSGQVDIGVHHIETAYLSGTDKRFLVFDSQFKIQHGMPELSALTHALRIIKASTDKGCLQGSLNDRDTSLQPKSSEQLGLDDDFHGADQNLLALSEALRLSDTELRRLKEVFMKDLFTSSDL